MFAAVFFVSVGMLIDPALVARHWPAVAVMTVVVVVGKIVGVACGAFLTGNGTRISVQAGMSLAQIGEFSYIIVALGPATGVTGEFLYPITVAVSAVTTLLTPWLIRASGPVAAWADRRAPRRLQTFSALYGSWIEALKRAPRRPTVQSRVRRLALLLIADAAVPTAIAAAAAVWGSGAASWVARKSGIPSDMAWAAVIVGAALLCVPFCVGIVRVSRKLGTTLADAALPAPQAASADLAAAPRRALVVTVQLGAVLILAIPVLAITQPFLPGPEQAILMLIVVAVMGVTFWRSAANLHGHARAGAQVILEALAAQARGPDRARNVPSLDAVLPLLPGLGEPVPVRLTAESAAVGRTLAELNLRGLTGATVLAILRGEEGVVVPTARERLREGDVLALAGTHEAVEAATAMLGGEAAPA
jgi:CPA2 family monovalent cation:H+ antiporter-2